METLIKEIAKQMLDKGLSLTDTQMAIGCLETREQFLKLKQEVQQQKMMTRSAALAMATMIAEE